MSMDKHIALFQATRQKENENASVLIKSMLIDFKDQNISFNYAINNIVEHFIKIENEHITNRSDLSFLLNVFEKGKGNYEKGMSLLVIPNILKPKFDKIEDLDITFDEYVTHLARRISFSRARDKFCANDRLFEAMYKIGKFDGYKNLPKFDVRMFAYEQNHEELEEEIFKLAYPNNKEKQDLKKKNKEQLKSNNPFIFNKDYIGFLKSKEFFSYINQNLFFNDDLVYEDYISVFFKEPNSHNSEINLGCETTLFALFLNQLKKNNIAVKISYTKIGNHKLFKTDNDNHLTRANISNSIPLKSYSNEIVVQNIIDFIEKGKLKC